jgi:hypothetical protein
LYEWRDEPLDFKIRYADRRQKQEELIKDSLFTCLEKEQNYDFEESYTELEDNDEFNTIKLKKDIQALSKELKRYRISFRKLLSYSPKNEGSMFACIKTAKGIVEDEWLLEKIEKKKTLPIQEVLEVVNIYRGTLEKNRRFIIALCLFIKSDLKCLKAYIDNTYAKTDQNHNIGTIVELAQDGAIVMTSDCSFVLVKKKKGMILGQQISFAVWEKKENHQYIMRKVVAFTSIIIFGIILLRSLLYFMEMPPVDKSYAVVVIDINPSLELFVNRNNIVVGINTLNRDADILLMDNDLREMPIDEAIEEVFGFAHDRGFVYEDKENLVLVSLALNPYVDKKGDEEEKFGELLNHIKLRVTGDEVIIPVVISVPEDTVKSASMNNLSIGRQYIFEKSKQESIVLNIGEVRKSSIHDLICEARLVEVEEWICEGEI